MKWGPMLFLMQFVVVSCFFFNVFLFVVYDDTENNATEKHTFQFAWPPRYFILAALYQLHKTNHQSRKKIMSSHHLTLCPAI